MDILILRNGQQTGPFTDEQVHALLRDGAAQPADMAWRPGMDAWLPLHDMLGVATAPTMDPGPQAPPPGRDEPATPRQKAFITYLHIPFGSDLTKAKAALLLNDAMKDPQQSVRIKLWDRERLRLFPDLFADEIKARKERRADYFLEICRTDGAEFFHDVAKAHAQVLVSYLDVHHPNWDEHAESSEYFFAALAEKFPQLVRSSARGQLKYPDGPKVAGEMKRSGVARGPRRRRSALMAALRGVVFGLLLLGVLYGVAVYLERQGVEWIRPSAHKPADVPAPPIAAAPIPRAVVEKPATPAPGETVAQTAPATPAPAPAPEPAPATPAPAMANNAETPAPAPGSTPMAGLFAPAPATPSPATPAPAAATPAARSTVTMLKATPVALRFGTSTLAAGTVVPFVSVDGANVLVRFGAEVVAVPLANTDLAEPAR